VELLKLNGYNTAMFGKSHEFTPWELSVSGPFDQWPTGAGFERWIMTPTIAVPMHRSYAVRSRRDLVFHDPNFKPSGNWASSDPSTTRDEFFAAASDSLKWWLP
jgi:arylsulfatase A-like enzyme